MALETGGGALANLVWGKGKELYTKAAELCTIGKWANFLHGIPDDYLLDVSACCLEASTANQATFKIRIMDRIESSPVNLLMFGKQAHDVECNL